MITKTLPSQDRRGRAKHGTRSVVYVNTELNNIVDEFAEKHGIFRLQFKSKTWGKLTRMVNRAVVEELRRVFKDTTSKFHFSARAGCACGCSPGYIMTHEVAPQANHWVDVEFTRERIQAFRTAVFSKQMERDIMLEILQQTAATAG